MIVLPPLSLGASHVKVTDPLPILLTTGGASLEDGGVGGAVDVVGGDSLNVLLPTMLLLVIDAVSKGCDCIFDNKVPSAVLDVSAVFAEEASVAVTPVMLTTTSIPMIVKRRRPSCMW